MNKPLVSIAVLTFNHEKFLNQALDSFLFQETNFDFEIVIGDDASKDNTQQIINNYKEKHPNKFKVNCRANNIGMIPNFIETLESCTGKYIAFCEGDDYWIDKSKLQKQVDFLENNLDFSICFHEAKIFEEETQTLKDDYITNNDKTEFDLTDLVKGNFMHTPTVMLRNNFTFPKWFKKLPIGDWPLYLLQIKNGKIKKLDLPMAAYRVHSQSAWSSKNDIYKITRTLKVMKWVLRKIPLSKEHKKSIKDQTKVLKKSRKSLQDSNYRKFKRFIRTKILKTRKD